MAPQMYLEMLGGVKIPAVGLGTWLINSEGILKIALDAGYRHFDTAFAYQNEEIIGRVLNEWISSGKLKREELFVTTKLPNQGGQPDRVEYFMKKSLENLQMDYVDLYLINFPISTKYVKGEEWPPKSRETEDVDHIAVWKKMEEQVEAGRTKAIGLCNFNIKQIDRILKSAKIKPVCLQIELHVYLQQRELVKFCQDNEIAVVAYAPLGSPAYNTYLTMRGKEPKKLPDILHDENIAKIGTKHKKSTAQVMLRYLLERNVAAIPKSATPERIRTNIDVFDFSLDEEDMKTLDDLEVGEAVRVCDYKIYEQYLKHPEFPFLI